MGTFNNILVELQDVEPLDRIGYREEQFHKLVDLLNKTESKLNYLTLVLILHSLLSLC